MLKIRLRRMGSRHRPFYRVVVSDSRRVPTSSALDEIGIYDPRQSPSMIRLDLDRIDHWMSQGAQPSDTVRKLVSKARRATATPAETTEEPAAAKTKAAPADAKEPAAETAAADEAAVEEAAAAETAADDSAGDESAGDATEAEASAGAEAKTEDS